MKLKFAKLNASAFQYMKISYMPFQYISLNKIVHNLHMPGHNPNLLRWWISPTEPSKKSESTGTI
jgi:hypothetical protein